VPPGTLRVERGYPAAVLLRGLLTLAFFTIDAYVALLLVQVRGWSAAAAGIALTAMTISWTLGSWVQARLSVRIPPERFVRIGFPVVAAGIAGLALVLIPNVPAWFAIPILALAGFGMGITYAQFALIVLRDVPRDSQGIVTSGLTLSDALGTALGTSVAAAFVSAAVRAGDGPGPGLAAAIAVGTAAAILGWILSPRLVPVARAARGGCSPVSAEELRAKIREVPDFPKPGILFYDITTLLKDPGAYRESIKLMLDPYRGDQLDIVVGMESRGFIFSAPMAIELGAGLVPVRKLGKLPAETISVEYALEYGSNTLEIHRDAIEPGQKVLIVDDLLATGGTVQGTIELVERLKGEVIGLAFLVELDFLNGRDRLGGRRVTSVIRY
jgi:adenine phosphoribosyltransferase